jgi:hypothetical protein
MLENFPWVKHFSDRQVKEIELSVLYKDKFNHGTDGHNAKIIIAQMVEMLRDIHYAVGGPFPDVKKVKEIIGQK